MACRLAGEENILMNNVLANTLLFPQTSLRRADMADRAAMP